MTHILAIVLTTVVLASACGGAEEPEPATEVEAAVATAAGGSGGLEITNVRGRMSPRMAGVAAAYLDIANPTDHDDRLVAASVAAEVAARVEIHETYAVEEDDMGGGGHRGDGGHTDDDGHAGDNGQMGGAPMMGMREIEAIEIPAGSTVELVPGGLHVMLFELAADLHPGDDYELTLEFERAGSLTVTVEVRDQA